MRCIMYPPLYRQGFLLFLGKQKHIKTKQPNVLFVERQASSGTSNEDHYQDILKFNYFPYSLLKLNTFFPVLQNTTKSSSPVYFLQSLCWEYFHKIFCLSYLFHLLFRRKTFLTFKWRHTEMEHILLNSRFV